MIPVPRSKNDPSMPEYPPSSFGEPDYPATPIKRIEVPGLENVWVKDESVGPFGIHKGRMAWEHTLEQRLRLQNKQIGGYKGPLPHMSIVSTGNAALAIQSMFRKYGLPDLYVLMDNDTDPRVISHLESIGCRVTKEDLSKRVLGAEEILEKTGNVGGINITAMGGPLPTTIYYDWMTYEILSESPDMIVVPFGTGDLYTNIFNIQSDEARANHEGRYGDRDPRLLDAKVDGSCSILGGSVHSEGTKAVHLYAAHLPFAHIDDKSIQHRIEQGLVGRYSNIVPVSEPFIEQARAILREQGIKASYSGATGLAAVLQLAPTLPKHARIIVVNTGFSEIDRILESSQ